MTQYSSSKPVPFSPGTIIGRCHVNYYYYELGTSFDLMEEVEKDMNKSTSTFFRQLNKQDVQDDDLFVYLEHYADDVGIHYFKLFSLKSSSCVFLPRMTLRHFLKDFKVIV